MEQIATQLGVTHPTISNDLREFVSDLQTKPRTSTRGRKGEGRPKGSRKRNPKPAAVQEKHEAIIALSDSGLSSRDAAAEVGVGQRTVDRMSTRRERHDLRFLRLRKEIGNALD